MDETVRCAGISPLLAHLLLVRGVEPAVTQRFLAPRLAELPDPALLLDLDRAVARLAQAISQGEWIAIHGDYDVDGISGTALLVTGLRSFGAQVEYHIPLRMVDGYGLSAEALRRARDNGCTVAVSVDCGISALAEAELARQLGLDLIVTDHHQPGNELPDALAVVDPHRPGDPFPDKSIAGVGVAFLLMIGLRRRLRDRGGFSHRPEPDLRELLDLVALGTIADVAPLTGVNRVLVAAGLQRLARGGRCGLEALRRVAGVTQVDAGAVGFRLAPRLNAAGRLEDAAAGVRLLLTDVPTEAEAIARSLDGLNRERQGIESATLEQAVREIEGLPEPASLVLAQEGWHPGVIGIVASRLAERYHRPVVLVALEGDVGKGSARSVPGFDLYGGLTQCREHLLTFGGHRAAAGLTLRRLELEPLRRALAAEVQRQFGGPVPPSAIEYDVAVDLPDLTPDMVQQLARLAPHGPGNPAPLLRLDRVRLHEVRHLNGGHLRFRLQHGRERIDAIGFGLAGREPPAGTCCDLLFTPEMNRWQGQERLQLRIRDLRPSGDGDEA